MKTLIPILFCLLLFNCSCKSNISQVRKDSIAEERIDTIIGVRTVPAKIAGEDYTEKEYFVVVKSDTSSFSCIITKNKFNGKISIHFRDDPYRKISTSFSSEDTTAVVEYKPVKRFNQKSTYKDQIKELKLILKYASNDYDLRKLRSVSLSMSSVKNLTQSITQQYINQHGEKFSTINYRKVIALIEDSQLTKDLTEMLYRYSIVISEISVDGLDYFVPQDSPAGTKPIFDGIIIFNLKVF